MKVNATIKKFLDEQKSNGTWTDMNTFLEARKDSEELSPDVWVRKWGEYCLNNDALSVPFYKANLEETIKPLPERLNKSFGKYKFNPNDKLLKRVYKDNFEDVPYDEFKQVLTNMRKYYNEEEARKDSIKERKERIDEVKDWNWRDIVASDYAKQRYIEEPNTAIFGKQAPGFKGSSLGAKADLAAGAAGVAADLVPYGKAFLIGPAIRAARDAAYLPTEYSKNPVSLGTGIASDFGLNAGAKYLANMRRGARIATKEATPEVMRTLNAETTTDAIKNGLTKMNPVNLKGRSQREIINIIDDLEESPLKRELQTVIQPARESIMIPVDMDKLSEIVTKYEKETQPAIQQLARMSREGKVNVISDPAGPVGPLYQPSKYLSEDIGLSKAAKDLSKSEQASLIWNKLTGKLNTGWPGQMAVQGTADLRGRGMGSVSYDNSEEFERQKKYFKETRGQDWLKYPSLAPKEQPGDPAWEAYIELIKEYNK